jgi:hypothetical protein
MKVVIFCGGMGTRLREETEYRPKPTGPIGERPIVWTAVTNPPPVMVGNQQTVTLPVVSGNEFFRLRATVP